MFKQSGRLEKRIPLAAPLWVTSLKHGGVFEITTTENVSPFGVRVVTRKSWQSNEPVLVSIPPGFCVSAHVIYCQKLQSENFALGIRLDNPPRNWVENLDRSVPVVIAKTFQAPTLR